jgi:predicted amidophosphoribosyltransferase
VDRDLSFERARSAFEYKGVAQALVTALKFHGLRELGGLMAKSAEPAFRQMLLGARKPIVTWVPSHPSVQRTRGYNQAEVLAQRLVEQAGGLPIASLVRKVTRTRHQLALGREERRRNLAGAFALTKGAGDAASGFESVVLIDDVYTTGATASEVAATLSAGLGLPAHVFTYARTLGQVAGQAD